MGYLGSKTASGALHAVIGSFPPHVNYIEPFAGSGAVIRAKPACAGRTIAIDRNHSVFLRFAWPRGCELFLGDALEFLRPDALLDRLGEGWEKQTLIYCDPPYVLSTRSGRDRYQYEMTDEDHALLLELLCGLSCSIVISGYPSRLYDERLASWRRREFQVSTRGGPRTEVLWMNFADHTALLSRFVGTDFRDRQRIKRKAARWRRMYEAMPAGERAAVMSALLEAGHGAVDRASLASTMVAGDSRQL